jgi:CRP/FNR family transcriptional regulator
MAPPVEIRAGVTLFRHGQIGTALYLIEEGLVLLTRAGAANTTTSVLRGPSWLLGAASCVLGRPHPATAETLTDCRLRSIRADACRRLQTDPTVGPWLHRMLAREWYEQVETMSFIRDANAAQRLDRLLIMLVNQRGERCRDGTVRLNPHLTRAVIGQIVGVARESASRLLSNLQREGVIRCERVPWVFPKGSRLLAAMTDAPYAPAARLISIAAT